MKLPVLLTMVLIALGAYGWEPSAGDLAFRLGSESAFSDAITSATAWGDSLRFDHVGIVDIDGSGTVTVVEAAPKGGVKITSWAEFTSGGGIVVKRLTSEFDASEVVAKAKSFIGEDYDWWYLPDNGKMYCSELVYESFIGSDGDHIFKAAPMNFRQPDGTMPEFWTRLFEEIGMPVPEGVPGTNPADMAKDPRLVEVARFIQPM